MHSEKSTIERLVAATLEQIGKDQKITDAFKLSTKTDSNHQYQTLFNDLSGSLFCCTQRVRSHILENMRTRLREELLRTTSRSVFNSGNIGYLDHQADTEGVLFGFEKTTDPKAIAIRFEQAAAELNDLIWSANNPRKKFNQQTTMTL